VEEPRITRIVLQLPPQAVHGHADDVGARRIVISPDTLEQLSRRDDAAGLAHQRVQQPELGDGEAHGLAVDLHGVLTDVEVDRPHLQRTRSRVLIRNVLPHAAQVRANASDELAVAERLCHVVIGTELEALHLVLFRSERGEHDDGDPLGAAPHLLEKIEAVPRAEVDVEDEEVGMVLVELAQRARRVVSDEGGEARALERELKQVRQLAVVVDDKDLEVASVPEAAGRVNQTFVPFPTSLSTPMCPRCASTMPFAMASPSPTPGSSLL